MTGIKALESVQYVTVQGRRLAVVDTEDWEALIEWLETVEDLEVAKSASESLVDSDGDRDHAGWLKWDDIRKESE
jgi:hypothetical protein